MIRLTHCRAIVGRNFLIFILLTLLNCMFQLVGLSVKVWT